MRIEKKQNYENILKLTVLELGGKKMNPGDNEDVNSTQVEHESFKVDESDQGDSFGAKEEKPRSKAQIRCFSDTNLSVIPDLYASLPLVPVLISCQVLLILPSIVFWTVLSSLLPANFRHLLFHV